MARILLLGCGRIGYVTAMDLTEQGYEVTAIDKDKHKLKNVSRKLGIDYLVLDIPNNIYQLLSIATNYDIVTSALPGSISYRVIESLIRRGVDVVDVSYFSEDPWKLHELALKSGSRVVVDAGLAPGISNALVGHAHKILDGIKRCRIYVGGISKDPKVFLGMALTWSVEDLVDEYLRPARAIIDGEVKYLDPLSYTGSINIPELGTFEYFVSDGLRTMIKSFRHLEELIELTLRHPGHLSIMNVLRDLGLLSHEELRINNTIVRASKILAELLKIKMSKYVEDVVILYIEALGNKGERKYLLYQEYDYSTGLTAMSRTTGFPLSIITHMTLENMIKSNGLIPPEVIGLDENLYNYFIKELSRRGIVIKELHPRFQ